MAHAKSFGDVHSMVSKVADPSSALFVPVSDADSLICEESVNREVNIKLSGAHRQYNLRVSVRVIFVDEKESGYFVPLLGRAELFDTFKSYSIRRTKVTLKPNHD